MRSASGMVIVRIKRATTTLDELLQRGKVCLLISICAHLGVGRVGKENAITNIRTGMQWIFVCLVVIHGAVAMFFLAFYSMPCQGGMSTGFLATCFFAH